MRKNEIEKPSETGRPTRPSGAPEDRARSPGPRTPGQRNHEGDPIRRGTRRPAMRPTGAAASTAGADPRAGERQREPHQRICRTAVRLDRQASGDDEQRRGDVTGIAIASHASRGAPAPRRDPTHDRVPVPGDDSIVDVAAEDGEPVAHPLPGRSRVRSVPGRTRRRRRRPRTELAVLTGTIDDRGRVRVLRRVLQRLEREKYTAASVSIGWRPRALGIEVHGERRPRDGRLRPARCPAPREAAGRSRARRAGCPAPRRSPRASSSSIARASRRVGPDERLRQAELHGERDQVLLGAVVDVALKAAALGVLRGDDPLPGRAELGGLARDLVQPGLQVGGQPDVRQDDPAWPARSSTACPRPGTAVSLGGFVTEIAPSSSPW